MTDEQILSLYRDRGLDSEYIEVDIIGFARTIAAAERERCAKVCEGHPDNLGAGCNFAASIRER
jgi:hypothetical protein